MKRIWKNRIIAYSLVMLLTATLAIATPAATGQQKRSDPSIAVPAETATTPRDNSDTLQAVRINRPEEDGAAKEPSPDRPTQADTPSDDDWVEQATEDPEERQRLKTLAVGDELYLAGDKAGAEELYRQVKPPFSGDAKPGAIGGRAEPITDPEQLSPAGRVYWREAQEGLQKKLESRIFVPLNLLVERHPEFIPGSLRLAEALQAYKRPQEAVEVLEKATNLYPNQPELLAAKIKLLAETEQWLEASIAARQFALLNPDDPLAPEFANLAETNLKKFRSKLREVIAGNAVANVLTGALGVAITGNPLAPLSAVQTMVLMLQGESAVGKRVAKQAQKQLEMVEDEEVLAYVNQLGEKLTKVAGRNDFEYEFHVVLDKDLNAFALPGGKVFVNAGAIFHTESEAELAGLLGHELSHAVLSHGFQLVTHGNLIGSVTRYLPLGGLFTDLIVTDYSRDMERQADVFGTRLLSASGYAADGLRNLMVTLKKENGEGSKWLRWLYTHPLTNERVEYLETLIQRGGYNRYAYEGVEQHSKMRKRVAKLLAEQRDDEEREGDEDKPETRQDKPDSQEDESETPQDKPDTREDESETPQDKPDAQEEGSDQAAAQDASK